MYLKSKKAIQHVAIVMAFALPASAAFAETTDFNFDVVAEISAETFFINAVNDWDKVDQNLAWNPSTGALATISNTLYVKSTIGEVKAHLTRAAELKSGVNTIPLVVKVGGKTMGVAAAATQTILSAPNAVAGSNLAVEVIPTLPAGKLPAGNYIGAVALVFDSVAP